MTKVYNVLCQDLRPHLPANKLDEIVRRLSEKVVLKSEAEMKQAELLKDVNDAHQYGDNLLEVMHTQNTKIIELYQQLQLQRRGNAKSSDTNDSVEANKLMDEYDKQEASVGTQVKQIESGIDANQEMIDNNEKESKEIMMNINRIKKQLGLDMKATFEEVEKKIEQLSRRGKDFENVKAQLAQDRAKVEHLTGLTEELRQEKKTLEVKLRNKQKVIQQLKAIKDTKKTIAVADEKLRPFYKRRNPQNDVNIAISPRSPWGAMSVTLPKIGGPTSPNNEETFDYEADQMCVKCHSKLDSSVYCPECVQHVLYHRK